jgi:hypothetical protein
MQEQRKAVVLLQPEAEGILQKLKPSGKEGGLIH